MTNQQLCHLIALAKDQWAWYHRRRQFHKADQAKHLFRELIAQLKKQNKISKA